MPRPSLLRLSRRAAPLLVTGLAVLAVTAPATAGSQPVPQAPVALPAAVEAPALYTPATSCDPTAKPGVVRFAELVQATYEGTGSSGIVRDCSVAASVSEHTEGRAWDWRVSRTNPTQVAQVAAFHQWLLAPDAAGNVAANARRLGLMYMIWDRQILTVSRAADGWRPYSCSGVTGCHEDHVHYSFTWAGAQARTSFWTGQVAATDFGPCRADGRMFSLPYSGANPTACPRWSALPADDGLVGGIDRAKDQALQVGATGSTVQLLQSALGGEPRTGSYTARTRGLVSLFQARRGLPRTGAVDTRTWGSLVSYATGGAASLTPPAPAPVPVPPAAAPAPAPTPPTAVPPAPAPAPPAVAPAPRPVPVAVSFTRPSVRVRTTSTLVVRAPAAARGRTAVRQQLVAGRWTSLDTRRLDASGAYRFAVRPSSRGVKTYRVLVKAAGSAPQAVSRSVRLTVL